MLPKWIEELRESYEGDVWAQEVLKGAVNANMQGKLSTHLGVIRYKDRFYVGPDGGAK